MTKNMTNKKLILTIALSLVVLFSTFASAVTVNSVSVDTLSPGKEGTIKIELKNNLNDEVTSVSIKLDFTNLQLNPIDNSEDSIDKIRVDHTEEFIFRIKAANDIKPGDYKVPYTIVYTINNESKTKSGSIGVSVKGNADLRFTVETTKPVVGEKDKLTLKIVNKGFGDAKFTSVKLIPEGFTLLSESDIYIGQINSDDFETATFDVIYTSQNPTLTAIVEYKDFDNKDISKPINLPITVYSQEKALELGLISKNNTFLYIIIIVAIILIIILYRTIRKSIRQAKRNKSQQA